MNADHLALAKAAAKYLAMSVPTEYMHCQHEHCCRIAWLRHTWADRKHFVCALNHVTVVKAERD